MRLIDADALAEEIEENMENGFPANENLSLYAISCIAHAPTVDVLDKISKDIKKAIDDCDSVYYTSALHKALEIIDKYR